jgi:menaquinone-9 beta-reductase
VTHNSDVFVVGAGPAGIATAIAASLKGFSVAVADSRKPPIEKACGEGLLPEAVASLRRLGIDLSLSTAFPFKGVRFSDDESSASTRITRGAAFGLRRITLHDLLVQRACEVGVSFLWGARVSDFDANSARVNGAQFRCKWLVGADGQNSGVRKWANLNVRRPRLSRFGFSRHYAVTPWTDMVEVHWGPHCQFFATPTGAEEVCIALLSHDPQMRIERGLVHFPEIARRLRGARPLSPELGSVTALGSAQAVARGRVALVGDASFAVDGIAGQGLSLAFGQAIHLAEAFVRDDLRYYEKAHRKIARAPWRMTRLLLLMDQSAWVRRKTLRLFARKPGLFSKMMSQHLGETTQDDLKAREILDLGWQVLRA